MADNQKVLMPKFAYRRRENMYKYPMKGQKNQKKQE